MKKQKITGYVVYEDHKRIAVVTLSSKNDKTKDMMQLWILPRAFSPVAACANGHDAVVCGNCPHRPKNNNSCYVNVGQAPQAVWKAYHRGRYPRLLGTDFSVLPKKAIRLGAYGDPAFLPIETIQALCAVATGWTGYTHQWRTCNQALRRYCMASTDSADETAIAHSRKWSTFRVKTAEDTLLASERLCLSEAIGANCDDCQLCDGKSGNYAITVHGSKRKNFKA